MLHYTAGTQVLETQNYAYLYTCLKTKQEDRKAMKSIQDAWCFQKIDRNKTYYC